MAAVAKIGDATAPARSPSPPQAEWITTPTAGRIVGALSFAQAMPDIAAVYGGPGTGKTITARHYAATGANVWVATMTPATAGVVPALEEVCAALGVPAANGAAPLHRAIVRRVAGSGGLLIVDEAHMLTPAALDQLRGIHDAGGIGLAILGSRDLHARMAGGESAPALERLRARIGRKLALAGSVPADAEAVADAWGITDESARKLLGEVAAKAGGLRNVVKLLRLAAMQGPSRSGFTGGELRAVWRELSGA